MACANCCLCVAALLDTKLPKALSDACAPNGFSVFIGLLFCEPPSTYSTFSPVTFYSSRLVPHCRCLGCYAFYLKMTINFTLLVFLLVCIQVTLLFFFCLCSYIRLLLLFFCEYSCLWLLLILLLLILYSGIGCSLIKRFFPSLSRAFFFLFFYLNKKTQIMLLAACL